jgi:hypothetical protein
MCGTAGKVGFSCAQLNEEQHVDRFQEERFTDEEIAGHDLVAMACKELAPRTTPPLSLRCGRYVSALEDIADSGAADREAQLGKFPMEA